MPLRRPGAQERFLVGKRRHTKSLNSFPQVSMRLGIQLAPETPHGRIEQWQLVQLWLKLALQRRPRRWKVMH
jgi:hypothetical protein